MKFSQARDLAIAAILLAVGLTAVACHPARKISPAEARQAHLDWNYKTTVVAYQNFGSTDNKWNAAATNLLAEFARLRSQAVVPGEDAVTIIRTNCQAAVQAGCDDPLVAYLYIKFAMDQTNSKEAFADAFTKAANDMKNSQYPPVRKFYAAARAMEQIYYAYGDAPASQQTRGEMWAMVTDNLNTMLLDKTLPGPEAADAADTAFGLIGGQTYLEQLYHSIEKPLFDNWPDDPAVWLFKGTAYTKMAWAARGGGYANQVSAEGWKTFGEDLNVADAALEKAWLLNTNDERIPVGMISVIEGQQRSRDEMELWFDRAMTIDPNCYEACHDKLHYLYPQWYGSRDDMVAFGRECVTNTDWGGNVPLILADAHREYWMYLADGEEKSNYWTQPEVWPDVKSAFGRFFALNPEASIYYYNYAWYAAKCEQWELFMQLIPKLGPVDYSYFGGEEEFDKMVEIARSHTEKTD